MERDLTELASAIDPDGSIAEAILVAAIREYVREGDDVPLPNEPEFRILVDQVCMDLIRSGVLEPE